MSAADAILNAVETIGTAGMSRYLQLRGWSELPHPNNHIRLFSLFIEEGQPGATVVLPANAELADFGFRMAEVIAIVAEVENRSVWDVIDGVLRWDRDILKARQLDRMEKLSSIPLEMAATAIRRLRDFVAYAACVENDPRPFFLRAPAAAKGFAEFCRFGHTFPGSFGFSVECPLQLTPNLGLNDVPRTIPFERKVMERVAIGYSSVRDAISEDDPTGLVQGYASGFNANLCEALIALYEAVDGRSVECTISWSPELLPEAAIRTPKLTINGAAYQHLTYAAKELEKVTEHLETLIVGPITALRSDEPPSEASQERLERIVTMQWEFERGTFIRLKVPLSASEYRLACDAHRDGRRISIRGKPKKEGKLWFLSVPHSFTVLI